MHTLTIDGKEIRVKENTTILEAAKQAGIEIPHYCYHPGLSIAGNCRICLVEIEGVPKLQISCYTLVSDGIKVHTQSERVRKARQAVLEFLLINHPLDCPVCDQAGECYLQIYYMKYGQYNSAFLEDKVKKHKAIPIGPTIMLDSERCILCGRCVRFCDEISKTSELGIFNRGDRSEIFLSPGQELNNRYSGNVADICPVGALTDRDFRFKCRVWYLKETPSICPGCSMGCNISIHYNLDRAYKASGKRVMRLKPRFNEEVNKWWLCDEGRYGYKFIDENRIERPYIQKQGAREPISWDDIMMEAAKILKSYSPESIGVIASPQCTNEDNFVLKRLFSEYLGISKIDYRVPSKLAQSGDDFLIRADKNPNSTGCKELGLLPSIAGLNVENMLKEVEEKKIRVLYLINHDLVKHMGKEAVNRALDSLDFLIVQGSNVNETTEFADLLLPAATYAEKNGTFINESKRVQKINRAFEPLGESLPDWKIFLKLAEEMGIALEYRNEEEIFADIAKEFELFEGLSYSFVGDEGVNLI
jgi:NADH-quinone oxidoreductase subunit G